MKRLADALTEYLALRRALGFKLRHETWFLPDFVSYLKAHRSAVITTELALSWARQPADAHPNWWAKKLAAVRRFARHRRGSDPRTEVPPPDLLPYRRQRQTPYIYSEREIVVLIRQASCLRHPLQAATYATLFGLLAATGMRVGEAIGLDQHDVDWRRALLTVRDGKFKKSRELPVHHTTLAALHAYAERRDRARPHRHVPSFFVSRAGTRLLEQNVWHGFATLRERAGFSRRSGRLPRIHDLRHTFAVRTVEEWYRAGLDVERRLPWLSTYLGHVSPSSTYWYLTATPELLALASERAERAWKVRP
jgi:site-specific recombinase XerD